MKNWVLFFLGTLAYFLYRFIKRKDKRPDFSLHFWIEDNWPELLFAFIFDLAAMLILLDSDTAIDLSQIAWFPLWLDLPVKLAGSFILGYGGGLAVYNIFKKKVKREIDKI